MKKTLLIFTILCYSCGQIMAQSGTASTTIKPMNKPEKVSVIISGKARSYYALSNAEPSVILVQGPGILKVHTRCHYKMGEKGKVEFSVIYTIDGTEEQSVTLISTEPSKQAVYPVGAEGTPGELQSFEIELLRGDHSIELKLGENSTNVAARYLFTPTKVKKQEWMSFSPLQPSEPVDLISKEITTVYYRFSPEIPLIIDVVGPTELRVLTRTENHFQMKGRINYRVQVRENSQVINTYQFSSNVSEVAVYRDENDLIPGTACEFVIYVPKGKHVYEVIPLDQDKKTLLGRVLIPVKDIKLTE